MAAPTTSLPEQIGGVRNWDYRYCWLRDATFTLYALMIAGYADEARAWRDWLLRAVAGDPAQLQIMYGAGGRAPPARVRARLAARLRGLAPVRIGNAAAGQFQLDVYGEVMDALHQAPPRRHRPETPTAWALQRALIDFLETAWREPDEGIWEVRGPRRHFTHSKVMAWVAFDRAVKARRAVRRSTGRSTGGAQSAHEIHARGLRPRLRRASADTFTQSYGSQRARRQRC